MASGSLLTGQATAYQNEIKAMLEDCQTKRNACCPFTHPVIIGLAVILVGAALWTTYRQNNK